MFENTDGTDSRTFVDEGYESLFRERSSREHARFSQSRERVRRDRITIIAEILSLAREPVRKTHIMYKINLSYSMSKRYVEKLLSLALLAKCSPQLQTTEKGANFLEKYDELMSEIGFENLGIDSKNRRLNSFHIGTHAMSPKKD